MLINKSYILKYQNVCLYVCFFFAKMLKQLTFYDAQFSGKFYIDPRKVLGYWARGHIVSSHNVILATQKFYT